MTWVGESVYLGSLGIAGTLGDHTIILGWVNLAFVFFLLLIFAI